MGSTCSFKKDDIIVPVKGRRLKESLISVSVVTEANIHMHYTFLKVIGHGQFGIVRIAVANKNKDGQKFAVKSIPKYKITSELKLMMRELQMLQSADHPNIIKLYETYEDSHYLHMVMELCTGGNLLERIVHRGTHSEFEAAEVMTKLCLAVSHLHELYICHRDIKPDNCIYVSADPNAEIKLIDFGLSSKFSNNDNVDKLCSLVGTPYYMAPEILRGSHSKECDIWSLGVLLYLLLSGRQAFGSSEGVAKLYHRIMVGEYSFSGEEWTQVSSSAKDLIAKMLVVEPRHRLTLKQVLRHTWFKQFKTRPHGSVPVEIIQSLKRQCEWTYFQKETMKIILKYLSSADIAHLKVHLTQTIFRTLDQDDTGFVSAASLAQAFSMSGYVLAEQEISSEV
jgi:calcium-dependent protein kinase